MSKKTHKRTGGRPRPQSRNQLPEEFEQFLEPLARRAAQERQTLGQAMAHGDLAKLIGRFVELTLQAELDHHLGYGWGERDGDLVDHANVRNGYSPKELKTQFGHAPIGVPRDRHGSFEPAIVPKYQGLSDAIAEQIVSLYAKGLSTRDLRRHIEELYHIEVDEGLVSRVVASVEPELVAWRSRPLEAVWACVFIDAVHLKVRQPTGVEPTAIYTAVGYDPTGHRHILGLWIGAEGQTGESASFWHRALVELKGRGVADIFIVCADGLSGLEEAVQTSFPRARFQPCVVHLVRNAMKYMPHKKRKEAIDQVRAIYQAPTYEAAQLALRRLEDRWGASEPHLCRVWREALPRLENLWGYGPALRQLVYTTNLVENIHRQVRKVTKTRASFPNPASALRLVTLALREVDQKYTRVRSDWPAIRCELELTFGERVPPMWPTEASAQDEP